MQGGDGTFVNIVWLDLIVRICSLLLGYSDVVKAAGGEVGSTTECLGGKSSTQGCMHSTCFLDISIYLEALCCTEI